VAGSLAQATSPATISAILVMPDYPVWSADLHRYREHGDLRADVGRRRRAAHPADGSNNRPDVHIYPEEEPHAGTDARAA
jgi:hypothetical protein